jgi:hypothetical protein
MKTDSQLPGKLRQDGMFMMPNKASSAVSTPVYRAEKEDLSVPIKKFVRDGVWEPVRRKILEAVELATHSSLMASVASEVISKLVIMSEGELIPALYTLPHHVRQEVVTAVCDSVDRNSVTRVAWVTVSGLQSSLNSLMYDKVYAAIKTEADPYHLGAISHSVDLEVMPQLLWGVGDSLFDQVESKVTSNMLSGLVKLMDSVDQLSLVDSKVNTRVSEATYVPVTAKEVVSKVDCKAWDELNVVIDDSTFDSIRGPVHAKMLSDTVEVQTSIESSVMGQGCAVFETPLREAISSDFAFLVDTLAWHRLQVALRRSLQDKVGIHLTTKLENDLNDTSTKATQPSACPAADTASNAAVSSIAAISAKFAKRIIDKIDQIASEKAQSKVAEGAKNYRGGSFWAGWVAYISFIRDVLGWKNPALERFEVDETLCLSCGWVWWHENVLVIADRPKELHFDEQGRAHCETGPAILYRDGWSIYCWHGVSVKQHVVMAPETITLAEITAEENAEVRRVLVERMTPEKYLWESEAKLVDTDFEKCRKGSAPRALIKDAHGDQWLVGTDGGTKRVYYMPVDGEVTSCKEAHESICGFEESRVLAKS